MNRLTISVAVFASLGLLAPAFAQTTTNDAGASSSMEVTTSSAVDQTSSASAEPSTSASESTASSAAPADTGTSISITDQQKTEIHQSITELNVAPVASVNFEINVGVVVPKTIKLTPLPVRIVKILPKFKGFLFFVLADGRIVIVDPGSLKIVIIIV
jgi:hypothetical protein